jgi:hypothetical protein
MSLEYELAIKWLTSARLAAAFKGYSPGVSQYWRNSPDNILG